MTTVNLFIPVRPKAVQSFRFGRTREKRKTFTYADPEHVAFKNVVSSYAMMHYQGPLIQGPVAFMEIFMFHYTPRVTKKTVIAGKGFPPRDIDCDIDNLQKGLHDALQGIVYPNDMALTDCYGIYKMWGPEDCIIASFEESDPERITANLVLNTLLSRCTVPNLFREKVERIRLASYWDEADGIDGPRSGGVRLPIHRKRRTV